MKYISAIIAFSSLLMTYSQTNEQGWKTSLKNGDIQKAKQILDARLSQNPNDLDAISDRGDIASFEKDWDIAVTQYKKLLTNDPKNSDFHFRYGGALGLKAVSVSKIKAVVYIPDIKKHLEKAAELDPKHIKSRRALVELYMQLPALLGGSKSRAQHYANQLNKIAPVEGALSQAYILKKSGEEKEALKIVQKALDQFKGPKTTAESNYLNYEFGKITAEYNTDLQKGLILLDTYIQNYNYKDIHSLEWAYYRKAQIQALLKNKPEATKFINRALAIRGNVQEAQLEKKKILAL
ncbi:hypothetical protein BH23BAC2_BH23BAC2_26910 [soil metagenome]